MQVSNMYTKTATSSEQCFKGMFVFFTENPKSTFVCAVNLFVCTFVDEQPDQKAIIEVRQDNRVANC